MAETYGREVEALKEQMGEKRIEEMKESIAVQDAITLIADAAVEA